MDRNGKKFEDPSETAEEIVALLGNIANRPDIQEVQERQVKEIQQLIDAAYDEGRKDCYDTAYADGYATGRQVERYECHG